MSSKSPSIKIVFEDDFILAIDKPAGIPSCILRQAQDDRESVEKWLQKKYPNVKLVHRLDNETSGILIAAKTDTAFETLRAIWKTPQVTKKYTALVLGKTCALGKITTPIAHHPRKKKKMMMGGKKARPTHTEFKTIKYFKNYSLLEVKITTGVRHQIRIHLASIGHPLAGDQLYQKAKARDRDRLNLNGHFLHLSTIEFPHPETGEMISLNSPLPKDLEIVLDSFLK